MAKGKTLTVTLARGIGGTLLLYTGMQLLLALLAVRGLAAEDRLSMLQTGTAALAILPGGVYAARHSGLGALAGALWTAAGFVLLTALMGLLCFDTVALNGETGMRLGAAAVGAVAAGALAGGGKKKQKRRGKRRREGALR